MATTTISRTLVEGQAEHDGPQPFSQSTERPRGDEGQGGSEGQGGDERLRQFLHTAFRRRLNRPVNPPGGDDDPDAGEGGGGEPPDEDPLGPPHGPPQNLIPIPLREDIRAMGSLPRVFDGDREKADAFLTEYLGYLLLNQGVPGFESPIRQVAMALTLIKGEKVDLWV